MILEYSIANVMDLVVYIEKIIRRKEQHENFSEKQDCSINGISDGIIIIGARCKKGTG